MGFILLFAAAILAFAFGGAAMLLWSTFRRTEQHRAALIEALSRVAELERNVAALTFGRALGDAPAALPAPPTHIALAPPSRRDEPPPRDPPPPAQAHIAPATTAAAQTEEIIAPPRPVEPAPASRVDHGQAHVSPPITLPRAEWLALGAAGLWALALVALRLNAVPPPAAIALMALAGAAMLGLALWRSARPANGAPWLGALGLLQLGGALACAGQSAAIDPRAALGAALTLALLGFALARRLGDWTLAAALVIGLTAPLLAAPGAIATPLRHGGLALLTVLIVIAARGRALAPFVWAAFAGALAWAFAPIGDHWLEALSTALYAATLGVLVLGYGWDGARAPRLLRAEESVLVANAAAGLAAAALFAAALRAGPAAGDALGGLCALIAATLTAAALRPGLAPAAIAAMLAGVGALALWPAGTPEPAMALTAALLALLCALGGVHALLRRRLFGALAIAFGALAVLAAAQMRLYAMAPPLAWAGAASALAAAQALTHLQLRKAWQAAAMLLAVGAALAASTSLTFVTPAPWPPLAAALAVPVLAFVGRDEPGLRAAAAALALIVLPLIVLSTLGAAPIPARTVIGLGAAAAIYGAARLLARAAPVALSSQTLYGAALAAAAITLSLETRRAFASEPPPLLEIGAHTAIWLTAALLLAREFGRLPPPLIWLCELGAFALATVAALIGGLVLANPWWGLFPAPAPGWQAFNALLLAYLGPALLFGFYAWRRERLRQPIRASIALSIALTLAFAYLTLELRRAFHGPAMAQGAILPAEAWAYTLGAIGFAAALLLLALERPVPWARHVALAIALAALAKAALFDLGMFKGLTQMAAFAALVAIGAGLVVLYRRFVLPLPPRAAKTELNANQTL